MDSTCNYLLINDVRHAEQSAHLAKFEHDYYIKKSKSIQDSSKGDTNVNTSIK